MYIAIINSMVFKHPKHKASSWIQQLKWLQLKSPTFGHLQKQFLYFIHSSPPLSEASTKRTRTLNWPLIKNLNRSRLNMEIQYKLLFVYHTKKVKDLCIHSWRVLHREQNSSCSWHPSRPLAVASSSTITSQGFKSFLKTHPCEIKIMSHERANHKCLVHLSSTVCSR